MSELGFAAYLWQHLERPLRNLCTAHARCIVAGVEDWSEAYDSILHYAIQRGALHLADEAFQAIESWIATTLLDEIEQAEAAGWAHWQQTVLTKALKKGEIAHG